MKGWWCWTTRVSWLGLLVAVVAPTRATAAAHDATAAAESLYVAGDLDGAERAFAALQVPKEDTLITLRRASLALLRNDTRGARALLAPILARAAAPRTARAITAECYTRELDAAHAAPLERALGREARARMLESFASSAAYRYEGPDRLVVPLVQVDPLPVLQVRIDGRGPYLFMIDTGGGDLVVDPVLADSLGCPRFGDEMGTFGGGRRSAVTKSRVGALALGDGTLHDVPASLIDCSRFSAIAGGRRIYGIVGTLVLARWRTTLDYAGATLILEKRVARAAATPPDSSRHVIPMWLGGDHFMLARGRLGNGPESLWFVDTGLAGAGVTAPAATLVQAGLTPPDTTTGFTGVGGGGRVKAQMFGVPRFQLGEVSANGLLGVFGAFPPTLESAFGYRIAGIISHAFFRSWRVTFDFDAMQLVLEKPAPTASR